LEKSKAVGNSDDDEPKFHEADLGTLPQSASEAEFWNSIRALMRMTHLIFNLYKCFNFKTVVLLIENLEK
jgi:hypothetical protein